MKWLSMHTHTVNKENQLHFQTNNKKEKWCIHSPTWDHQVVRLMRPNWQKSFQSIDLVLLMWIYVMCPENALLRSIIVEKVNDLPPEITTALRPKSELSGFLRTLAPSLSIDFTINFPRTALWSKMLFLFYLFLAVLGLHCYMWSFSSCGE